MAAGLGFGVTFGVGVGVGFGQGVGVPSAVVVGSGVRGEEASCGGLRHVRVGAERIGLPTTGAEVTSSRLRHEGGRAYCRVLGRIFPVDPTADAIRFELNLPVRWNGKALRVVGCGM